MVVSKDSRRKRKESPPQQQQQQATSSSSTTTTTPAAAAAAAPIAQAQEPAKQNQATLESSPEIPKRTKVQAQRKFAQGQSAPPSSLATSNATVSAATSNNGASTSAASRAPPTEILPNKRPKTEDFLTFLCFRGTGNLPPHLDFLNQGTSKETSAKGLKRGKAKETQSATPAKTSPVKKKGRPKGSTKAANALKNQNKKLNAENSKPTDVENESESEEEDKDTKKKSLVDKTSGNDKKVSATKLEDSTEAVMPFAVRKRSDVVASGNRSANTRQLRNVSADDAGTSKVNAAEVTSPKRRSGRKNLKDKKLDNTDEGDNDDDHDHDHDDAAGHSEKSDSKNAEFKKSKTPLPQHQPQRKSQTPSVDNEVCKIKKNVRNATANSNKKAGAVKTNAAIDKVDESPSVLNKESLKNCNKKSDVPTPKDKAPVKRPRQKESPIFIPSPEPSGRMTRQRAFFEPVKVPGKSDGAENASITSEKTIEEKGQTCEEKCDTELIEGKASTSKNNASVRNAKNNLDTVKLDKFSTIDDEHNEKTDKPAKGNADLKVFDFSSDDEQPLAKTMKVKQGKGANKRASNSNLNTGRGGRRSSPSKSAIKKNQNSKKDSAVTTEDKVADVKKNLLVEDKSATTLNSNQLSTTCEPNADIELETNNKSTVKEEERTKQENTSKRVTGKQNLKRISGEEGSLNESSVPSKKVASSVSVGRKRSKVPEAEKVDCDENAPRNQRPMRKTKEAATIYMGIIGHKLQLPDDEDDDLSLNSFPDLPNVKEMEKMEIELKKNATSTSVAVAKAPEMTDKSKLPITSAAPEKPATTARRGRPPKQGKQQNMTTGHAKQDEVIMSSTVADTKKSSPTKLSEIRDEAELLQREKDSIETSKNDSEDEDFLLKKELNETKRKLEKSFSDSDDEPLAIKVQVKSFDNSTQLPIEVSQSLTMVHSTLMTTANLVTGMSTGPTKLTTTSSPILNVAGSTTFNTNNTSPVNAYQSTSQASSPFKTVEKKSPVPTSKILNVPATYGNPPNPNPNIVPMNVGNFNKAYMPPQSPMQMHYHSPHAVRAPPPPQSQASTIQHPSMSPMKSSPVPAPPAPNHIMPPMTPQSPLKYSAPTPAYIPPIEAYPSPKINPNFLTPKFDRLAMPRPPSTNFPSPSPVRFESPQNLKPLTPVPPNSNVNKPNIPAATSVNPTISSNINNNNISNSNNNNNNNNINSNNNNNNNNNSNTSNNNNNISVANINTTNNTSSNNIVNSNININNSNNYSNTNTNTNNSNNSNNNNNSNSNNNNNNNNNNSVINNGPSTSAAAAAAAAAANINGSDPLKDEIGSILAANLMPSKEESGKIFGIASVSLAQSSGPDNTKCTLGKCGSIHKPALGPVVPTEGYLGDQLSSKERRKAKVNMTHEQIQKWLIECSSNPDDIQDDLEDDFDDNLRPNLFATTPPPTRDDKESTSFSSSSKATRDLGKSENAWTSKGATLKSTSGTTNANKKDEPSTSKAIHDISTFQIDFTGENDKGASTSAAALLNKPGTSSKASALNSGNKNSSKGVDKKAENSTSTDKVTQKDSKQLVKNKESNQSKQSSASANESNRTLASPAGAKQNRKNKNAATLQSRSTAVEGKSTPSPQPNKPSTSSGRNTPSGSGPTSAKQQKRTPVYSQKTQKSIELKETTTTSHRKSAPFSYGAAFSADNEKSIYSFDKDDNDEKNKGEDKSKSKQSYRRQNARDSSIEDAEPATVSNATNRAASTQGKSKRAAAAAAERANKDIATASQSSSVSLTLSSAEKSKLVKVGLEAEKAAAAAPSLATSNVQTTKSGGKASTEIKNLKGSKKSDTTAKKTAGNNTKGNSTRGPNNIDGESDSEINTFYIPLSVAGPSGSKNDDIQGVALKLGREGPEGPHQKVIMHATLVTKSQVDTAAKSSIDQRTTPKIVEVKGNLESTKVSTKSTSDNANAPATTSTAGSTHKSGPSGTAQQRPKPTEAASTATGTGAAVTAGSSLARVNSNSSLLSGSGKSRTGAVAPPIPATSSAHNNNNKKFKDDTPIKMANNTAFPRHDDPTQMVDAPIFRPTEKEFADPIEFIERITPIAARFGICKIIPPSTFRPECRISDDMRFTAYNQYVHKMLNRWGPSAKELSAIKKYLATQSIVMNHPPWIGGMEVDLPRLYHTVQELGGLKEVIEKKKWARVAEDMCIPKLAQDRVTKLDDIYCKYLLPYDTLSPAERQKLFDEVEADWAKREARARRNADRFVITESVSNEEDDESTEDDEESEEEVDGVSMECIVKGRSMALSQFYRIARNTMALWFKNTEPTVNDIEAEFWRHVAVRDSHVCVHSGSIDSSGWGYGFPSPGPKGKGSNYARHPWNLKVLTNNPGSVLRSLGPVMGVTVPTLHVGMLFSACCWYRDPHGLSWIEYLHTGASKLWYGIPDDQSANFRAALTSLIPTHCQNKTIWLPCDTVMVPPHMLTDRGVSLCRIEQKPGEFIVVFPRAYTSSLATGYVVSESVYFATTSWLDLAKDDFRDIHDSCEPAMFSLEQLLFALGYDQRVPCDTLEQMLPMLHEVCEKESAAREQLKAAGVTSTEMSYAEKGGKSKKQTAPHKSVESECDLCRANLYISMVRTDEGNIYCLQHALKNLNNGNIQAKQCKLIHAYNVDDIEKLIKILKDKIQQKRNAALNKKSK